jgi:hypothetical protein
MYSVLVELEEGECHAVNIDVLDAVQGGHLLGDSDEVEHSCVGTCPLPCRWFAQRALGQHAQENDPDPPFTLHVAQLRHAPGDVVLELVQRVFAFSCSPLLMMRQSKV